MTDKKALINDISDFIEKNRENYTKDLAALIEVPSVSGKADGEYVYGKECAEVLERALKMGDEGGFKTENHEYYCGSIIYGDKEREIGIIGHLDVVPSGDGWTYLPYKLTAEKGMLIGRGTEDDKGPVVAALYALKYLKSRNIELPFAVRLIMGCSEECGMTDLPHFLKVRKAPEFSFTPDSEFPVCVGEKGIGTVHISVCDELVNIREFSGGTVRNAVAGKAEAVILAESDTSEFPECDGITVSAETADGKKAVRIVAKGKTAHAAMPESGVNAIGMLAKYILECPVSLTDKEKNAIEFISCAASEYLGNTLGIADSDEPSGYLTCVGSVAKCENGVLKQTFNIRLPVTLTWDNVFANIEAVCNKYSFAFEWSSKPSKPYYISPDRKEIKILSECCETVLEKECKPYTMGGGTYARHMPNTVAFGCRIPEYAGMLGAGRGCAHDRDEYLSVYEFESSIKIFVLSVLSLSEEN